MLYDLVSKAVQAANDYYHRWMIGGTTPPASPTPPMPVMGGADAGFVQGERPTEGEK